MATLVCTGLSATCSDKAMKDCLAETGEELRALLVLTSGAFAEFRGVSDFPAVRAGMDEVCAISARLGLRLSCPKVMELEKVAMAAKRSRDMAFERWLCLGSRNLYAGTFDDWWKEIGGVFDEKAVALLVGNTQT